VGALVLLCAAFVLGMKVGKQIASEEAKTAAVPQTTDRLAAIDARTAQAQKQAQPPPPIAASTEMLTFAQELTRPSTPPPAPLPPSEPAKEPVKQVKEEVKEAKSASTPVPPAVVEPAPVAAKPTNALLAAFEKVGGASSEQRSGFALQVASLPSEAAAQGEIRRLAAKGLSAWFSTADVKGQTYYRVKVGPYATKAEAQEAQAEIARQTGAQPIVTNAN
jgi:septal ring-binding cell division protein DamX